MDRGAWRTTVHGVAKSQTRLSNLAHWLSGIVLSFDGAIAVLFHFVNDQIVHVLSCPPPGMCVFYHFLSRLAGCTDRHQSVKGSRPCGCVLMSKALWTGSGQQAVHSRLPGVSIWTVPGASKMVPPLHLSLPRTCSTHSQSDSDATLRSPLSEVPIPPRWGQTRPERLPPSPSPPRHPLLGRPLASLIPLPVTMLGPFIESQRVGHDWTTEGSTEIHSGV